MAYPDIPEKKGKLTVYGVVAVIIIVALILAMSVGTSGAPSGKLRTLGFITALTVACQSYITDAGALPKDVDNHWLTDTLSGADSGKIYMSFKTSQRNSNNELVDGWGTPLRVTRISNTELKIESAGPDKTFGTADDITNQ